MKTIPLTQGQHAIVDDDDYLHLNQWKWYFASNYVKARNGDSILYMHRKIMNCPKDMVVDHKNHNTLDNRKSNLRICTHQQNQRNKSEFKGVSQYKGVSWKSSTGQWNPRISINRFQHSLGLYDNEEDAAIAYNVAAQLLFGEFAYLNNV